MKWRKIYKDIASDKKFVELKSDTNRLIFVLTIIFADKNGRGYAMYRFWEFEILAMMPHITEEIFNNAIDDLAESGMIKLYELYGKRYYEIPKFKKHQGTAHFEGHTIIPDPQGYVAKRDGGNIKKQSSKSKKQSKTNEYTEDFEYLWHMLPRGENKKAAFRHYKASLKEYKGDIDALTKDITTAIHNFKEIVKGREIQHIKTGGTFFNNWKDYLKEHEQSMSDEEYYEAHKYDDIPKTVIDNENEEVINEKP